MSASIDSQFFDFPARCYRVRPVFVHIDSVLCQMLERFHGHRSSGDSLSIYCTAVLFVVGIFGVTRTVLMLNDPAFSSDPDTVLFFRALLL